MTARPLPAGVRGFDCNAPVSHETARSLVMSGFRFALRYLPRVTAHAHDLSAAEVGVLHQAGLAVMGVQHVESAESWSPTDDKGRQYGETAAQHALACGLVTGSTVWLDLEGVAGGTDQEQIIRYCNYWHGRVKAAGYQPGIYVGWHSGLSPDQLYRRLKFDRYWAAYNLNHDEFPAVRGVCLRQRERQAGDVPAGSAGLPELDLDLSYVDSKGGVAMVHAPDEWDV